MRAAGSPLPTPPLPPCPHCFPRDRCCDKFLFTVHPVFGAFYNIRIPLLDETQEEDELGETPFFTRNICFRRKFHTKPKVKAFTPESVSVLVPAAPPPSVPSVCVGGGGGTGGWGGRDRGVGVADLAGEACVLRNSA